MTTRRITITAIRRRRTVVLTANFQKSNAEPASADEQSLQSSANRNPESIPKTTIKKRRNDHEWKDENDNNANTRDIGFWIVPSAIKSAISEKLFARSGKRGATIDGVSEQQLQKDKR
jgi:hypothetical protein